MADNFESKVQVIFEAINRANAELEKTRKQILDITAAVGGQRRATEPLIATNERLKGAMAELNNVLASQTGRLGRLGRMAASAAGPVAALAGAIIATGAAAVTSAQAIGHYQQEIDLMAEATDLSTRTITALQVAASNVGRDFGAIQSQLVFFSRRVGEAANGNEELERTFQKLGVRIKDAASGDLRDMNEILDDTSARLRATGTAAERNRIMVQLFGRGGATAFAILSQSIEENAKIAETKGIKLSAAQEEIARAAESASTKLKQSWKGFQTQASVSFAAAGTTILNWATGALDNLGKVRREIELHTIGALQDLAKVRADRAAQEAPKVGVVDVGAVTVVTSAHDEKLREIMATAKKQVQTLNEMIPILDWQRSIGAITADQEADKLASMKGQAMTAEELLIIERKVVELRRTAGMVPGARPGAKPFGPMPEGGPLAGFQPFVRDFATAEAIGGQLTTPAADKMTEFLLKLEDQLEAAAVATDSFSDAMVGFTGTMEMGGRTWLEVGQAVAETFQGSVRQGVRSFLGDIDEFIAGTKSAGQALIDMILAIEESVLVEVASGGILKILGLQGGGQYVGRPIMAQTGVMMAGTRGVDSKIVAMGRGEGLFSNAVMDKMERFLNGVFTPSAPRLAMAGTSSRSVVFSRGAFVFNGIASTKGELRQLIRGPFMREIKTAIARELD